MTDEPEGRSPVATEGEGRAGQDRTDRTSAAEWWRDAVVYQVYIRSFADGDDDGIGDIEGIRSRLPYLAGLGVDAIWITPWYPSPFADGGYDVADYCDVAPLFGDLAQAEALVAEVHRLGLRIILDLVPNHTSDQHPWFRRALAAGAGAIARDWYWFRPGQGPGGAHPPNDWRSVFGGTAWERLPADGDEEEPPWYLHLFAPEQPDLNWTRPEVAQAFDDILRFWFDRGVDGFRIDVANAMAKDPALPNLADGAAETGLPEPDRDTVDHPYWDREDIHEIFRRWRAVGDSYRTSAQGPRMFVAEAWRVRRGGLARYLRPDELQSAFNFEFLAAPWDPDSLRTVIDRHIEMLDTVRASPTWVLSNHDTVRVATRYAPTIAGEGRADPTAGLRRARAAALLLLALPGGAYIYQGDELGLPEVEDLPDEARQDPIWRRSGGSVPGRDGCRVPLPWNETAPALGFGSTEPWLPQPADWRALAVSRQADDPASMLSLYRAAIALRRRHLVPADHHVDWREAGRGVLAFGRGNSFRCIVNFTTERLRLEPGWEILLASQPIDSHQLAGDAAAWLVKRA
jgi:alpha-glucosidase